MIYSFCNKAGRLNEGGQTYHSLYLKAVLQALISCCEMEAINNAMNKKNCFLLHDAPPLPTKKVGQFNRRAAWVISGLYLHTMEQHILDANAGKQLS